MEYLTVRPTDIVPFNKLSDIDINLYLADGVRARDGTDVVRGLVNRVNESPGQSRIHITDLVPTMLGKVRGYCNFASTEPKDADFFLHFASTNGQQGIAPARPGGMSPIEWFMLKRFCEVDSILWYRDYDADNRLHARRLPPLENPGKTVKKFLVYARLFGKAAFAADFERYRAEYLAAPDTALAGMAAELSVSPARFDLEQRLRALAQPHMRRVAGELAEENALPTP